MKVNVMRRLVRGRVLLCAAFCILCSSTLKAQSPTAKEVFKAMPDSLLPYLSQNNRLDFIDFMESNMEAKVTNALNGKSEMTALSDRYLCLQLNEASRLQLRLLPVNTPVDSMNYIVCMVRTYGVEAQSSVVSFYSCLWRQLELTVDQLVTTDQLLVRPSTMTNERFLEVRKILTPCFLQAELSPTDDIISFSVSNPVVPQDDEIDVGNVKALMSFKWNGVKFNKL